MVIPSNRLIKGEGWYYLPDTEYFLEQAEAVRSFVIDNLDVLYNKTNASLNKECHFPKDVKKKLPVSFQLKLPLEGEISSDDLKIFLHYKQKIRKGCFKSWKHSSFFSLRDRKVHCSATATPVSSLNPMKRQVSIASIRHEVEFREELSDLRFTMPILSSVVYLDKKGKEKINMVMPLAECDLCDKLDEGALDGKERRKWTLQLLKGLLEIEEKRLRLNDIKPGNILIKDGNLYYTDFGFISYIDNLPDRKVSGTPLFFSHEQHQCQSLFDRKKTNNTKFDFSKSDIFSLGMVLYRMKHQNKKKESDFDEAYPLFALKFYEDFDNDEFSHQRAHDHIVEWNKTYQPKDKEDAVIAAMMKPPEERISIKDAIEALTRIYL